MDVNELKQYIDLKEIRMYDEEIQDCTDKDEIEYLQMERAACAERVKRIDEFIDSIPDSRTKIVFARKYRHGEKWTQIAFRIGSHDRQTPKRIHDKYIISWRVT